MTVPVIDLFAGPGGLGEGFARAKSVRFDIAVSIEKDPMAFETLLLRAAHRAYSRAGRARQDWRRWDSIIHRAPWEEAFNWLEASADQFMVEACATAREEAWNFELGPHDREMAIRGIRKRLRPHMHGRQLPQNIVLIGGPPCQAYSVVGRSRNRGTEGYVAEQDQRHYLYREYLQVIREFRPAVFIMENVKGILTSRVAERHIFDSITTDLRRPDLACGEDTSLHYVLVALPAEDSLFGEPSPSAFIVKSELHGIPQARHRVVICGVRRDVFDRAGQVPNLKTSPMLTVHDAIGDLPPLRADISHRGKGVPWDQTFKHPLMASALQELKARGVTSDRKVALRMLSSRAEMLSRDRLSSGTERATYNGASTLANKLHAWYRDRPLSLLANHAARSHMPEDLIRYLFVASYGKENGSSPKLADFPVSLLPKHRNVDPENPGSAIFKDRFRVQLKEKFSMTVTSHIGKDGHAFIHPDPDQCRSLTVREAARLQTFPDSYVFLGNRTSQFTQVGNAVPPLLANQIAEIVGDVIIRAGLSK